MSSSHKVSLHLSRNNSLDSQKESLEQKLKEAPKCVETTIKTQESLKEIREKLKKTTEKYQNSRPDKDIAYYKQLVFKLEQEKKELIEKNNSHAGNNEKLIQKCKDLYKSAKKYEMAPVESCLGTFPNFLNLINSFNLSEALLRSITLCNQLLNTPQSEQDSKFHINQLVEEDITQLLKETNALSSKINRQKQRISEIHQKLENSAEKSKMFLDSFDTFSLSDLSLPQNE